MARNDPPGEQDGRPSRPDVISDSTVEGAPPAEEGVEASMQQEGGSAQQDRAPPQDRGDRAPVQVNRQPDNPRGAEHAQGGNFMAPNNSHGVHHQQAQPQQYGEQQPQPMFPPPMMMEQPPPAFPPVFPPPEEHPAFAMTQYYEQQMRNAAASYASAAAGAAWAASRLAADFASGQGPPPPAGLPVMNVSGMYAPSSSQPQQLPPFPPAPPAQPVQGPPPPYWPGSPQSFVPADQAPSQPPQYPILPPQPPPDQWQPGPQHDGRPPPGPDDARQEDSIESSRQHRRKRQQRMPPGSGIPEFIPAQQPQQQQQQRPPPGRAGRRRMRSDGDNSSSDGGSTSRRYYRGSGLKSSKKKARSDASLLGKTAVAALYEWCDKRQLALSIVSIPCSVPEEFEFVVVLEKEHEWGRGKARTKAGAKHEAARRALQALAPGVIFDEQTGILTELPRSSPQDRGSTENATAASLEDLAPNLAKRLAIGRDDAEEGDAKKHTGRIALRQPKRTLNAYPGTSTTSEEEVDESAYYASRGASVCSSLLHSLVQIDQDILDAPTYDYKVIPLPAASRELKRKASSKSAAVGPRGTTFECTARLTVREPSRGETDSPSRESASATSSTHKVLETVGISGTKREAKHVASAKLLALLFPDCETMVEVKAAAEAKREQYAASKARKNQATAESRRRGGQMAELSGPSEDDAVQRLFADVDDPPLPSQLKQELKVLLGQDPPQIVSPSKRGLGVSDPVSSEGSPDVALLRLSRRKQIDAIVESALMALNDCDGEGRVLPNECTEDDVGKTILRRAEPEDLARIRKLFSTGNRANTSKDSSPVHGAGASLSPTGDAKSSSDLDTELVSRLWSQPVIALLLCRAIAPYDDPPLGCAVLTIGFSMEHGRLLRVAEMATETHLPTERFLECLHDFSTCMKCKLEVNPLSSMEKERHLDKSNIEVILQSHLTPTKRRDSVVGAVDSSSAMASLTIAGVSSPLQSVQEEGELSPDSDQEPRRSKQRNKPSKRSRVK